MNFFQSNVKFKFSLSSSLVQVQVQFKVTLSKTFQPLGGQPQMAVETEFHWKQTLVVRRLPVTYAKVFVEEQINRHCTASGTDSVHKVYSIIYCYCFNRHSIDRIRNIDTNPISSMRNVR